MKTQKQKLEFKTHSLVELSEQEMFEVEAGTGGVCAATAATSVGCAAATVVISIAWLVF